MKVRTKLGYCQSKDYYETVHDSILRVYLSSLKEPSCLMTAGLGVMSTVNGV